LSKRSDFQRKKNDAYDTPYWAVAPLLRILDKRMDFCEPCAGNGRMIRYLEAAGHKCVEAWDIKPRSRMVKKKDARQALASRRTKIFITNPPWDRTLLHPIIRNLIEQRPAWLLFDADWMHTQQAYPLWLSCALILSVGRVRWIAGSKNDGKDNACWYLFKPDHDSGPKFYGRRGS
jgi:hypothetical protein